MRTRQLLHAGLLLMAAVLIPAWIGYCLGRGTTSADQTVLAALAIAGCAGYALGRGELFLVVTTYELWTHRWTATFYAVRLSDGCVTGLCGPLPPAPREARGDLSGYAYDERLEALRCAQKHPEQFALAEAWRRGRAEGCPPLG